VARLSDLQQLSASAKTVEEVTATGLRYSLMTAYTSFVAIDSQVRSTGGKPEQVRQPLPMPEGVSNGAVGGALASASIQGWLMKPQGAVRGGVAGGGGEHAIAAPDAPSVAPAPPPLATAPSPAPEPRMSRKNVVQFDDFSVAGSLDRRSISLVIQRHRAAIRSVYDTALKSNPNLSGRVVVKFTIDASGAVTGASVTSSTVADAELVKKLLEVVRRMRFDPTPGGGSVTVNYPFVFRLP
jgi:Ca-activated chloride channel family protein